MQVFNLVLPLFAIILVGYVSAKLKKLPESALGWMNFFIVYAVLPALFFQLIRKAPIENLANLPFILASSGVTIILFIYTFFLARWVFRSTTPVATIQAVAGSYSNVGYMGPALTLAALGDSALVPTIVIFCVDNAFLFIVTPLLMALSSRNGEQNLLVFLFNVLRKVVLHPFILATIVGVLVAWLEIPVPTALDKALTMLSNSAAPAALFAMGVVIANRKVYLESVEIPLILVVKLLMHPFLVWVMLKILGPFEPVWEKTALLMACLPPALNVYVLAGDYRVYVREASTIVLLGTSFAIVSVTVVLLLIS